MKYKANNNMDIADKAIGMRMISVMRPWLAASALAVTAWAVMSSASAQPVDVKDAWVRPTVAGQLGTGAFMTLTAKAGTRLVGLSSPVAGIAEVHEMKLEGEVMKMRAMPGLDLPAGKPVELKPGGYHVMLMDLKAPLLKDTMVDLTLQFKDAKGVATQQVVKLAVGRGAVAAAQPAASVTAPAPHGGHAGHSAHSPAMK